MKFGLRDLVWSLIRSNKNDVTRAVIYGAGSSGAQLASSLRASDNYEICGFIDDDTRLNSRNINKENKKLKLTERELDIIMFLKNHKTPQKIEILQNQIWKYSSNLETHTVETHVYRLRKKIKETFNDDNFIISKEDGYIIK